MSREPMSHTDAAWLRMDSATNLMVVNSVLWFDRPLDQDALRTVLDERLVGRFRRFRQQVVEEHGIWWQDVPDFDVRAHVHRIDLPRPGGRRELEELVASYLTVPLDRSRPLWDLYVIDDYYGGSALFFRMHHCIADGIALTRVLLSLTDGGGGYAAVADDSADEHHGMVRELAATLAHEAVTTITHPTHVLDLARAAVGDARAVTKLLVLPPDSSYWRRTTGVDKQVVWSDPIPLDRVKEAAHATGTTVNDVLLAAVSGALRADRERAGETVHDVRVLVPFNLRRPDEPLPSGLGNRFGLVYLDLPLTPDSPQERLEEMSRRMQRIKHSAEGVVSFGVLDLVGQGPSVVERLAIEVFSAKGSAVMTNVPGPRQPVTLAGARLVGTIGWAPTSGSIGLGLSIFSYAGDVVVGLASDRTQLADGRVLIEDMLAELQALMVHCATV